MKQSSRRIFLRNSALAGAASFLLPPRLWSAPVVHERIKLGVIGTGLRGQWVLSLAARDPGVEIPAICDIDDDMIRGAQRILREAGRPEARVYASGDEAYREMLATEALDGVYIATPWKWHHPMAVAAMDGGVHVGVEVPAALTVAECWDLVDTSERTGKHCMIMENVCYRRDVMAVLQMVRAGLFGELVHCQGGYQHDLRHVKLNDGKQPYGGGVEFGEKGFSESRWRTGYAVDHNGDLYPTHGLGPVSAMLDINRGNRMVHLTSTASQSRGLHAYIVREGGPKHPNAEVAFRLGDVVTTVIQCAGGQTIVLSHDTSSPRPYSLNFRVQGTRGIWMKDNRSIYIEGKSPEPHRWESEQPYLDAFDHPLWKRFEAQAAGSGHGGMDFFIVRALVESLRRGVRPPIDVYDAVSMSVVRPLSEQSIAAGSAPISVPDFTRGKWKTNGRIFGLDDHR